MAGARHCPRLFYCIEKTTAAEILIPAFRIVGGGDEIAADVTPPVLSLWYSEGATPPMHVGF